MRLGNREITAVNFEVFLACLGSVAATLLVWSAIFFRPYATSLALTKLVMYLFVLPATAILIVVTAPFKLLKTK